VKAAREMKARVHYATTSLGPYFLTNGICICQHLTAVLQRGVARISTSFLLMVRVNSVPSLMSHSPRLILDHRGPGIALGESDNLRPSPCRLSTLILPMLHGYLFASRAECCGKALNHEHQAGGWRPKAAFGVEVP
jgi:hypothetical protein